MKSDEEVVQKLWLLRRSRAETGRLSLICLREDVEEEHRRPVYAIQITATSSHHQPTAVASVGASIQAQCSCPGGCSCSRPLLPVRFLWSVWPRRYETLRNGRRCNHNVNKPRDMCKCAMQPIAHCTNNCGSLYLAMAEAAAAARPHKARS